MTRLMTSFAGGIADLMAGDEAHRGRRKWGFLGILDDSRNRQCWFVVGGVGQGDSEVARWSASSSTADNAEPGVWMKV